MIFAGYNYMFLVVESDSTEYTNAVIRFFFIIFLAFYAFQISFRSEVHKKVSISDSLKLIINLDKDYVLYFV